MTYEEPHATVDLTTPQGETVAIDTLIAPLIEALWAHGVTTRYCCQGGTLGDGSDDDPYEPYAPTVTLGSFADLTRFLDLVGHDSPRLDVETWVLVEGRVWHVSLPFGIAPVLAAVTGTVYDHDHHWVERYSERHIEDDPDAWQYISQCDRCGDWRRT